LGEHLARATRRVAEEAPRPEAQPDGVAAPGQVERGPAVPTVPPGARGAAGRAACLRGRGDDAQQHGPVRLERERAHAPAVRADQQLTGIHPAPPPVSLRPPPRPGTRPAFTGCAGEPYTERRVDAPHAPS